MSGNPEEIIFKFVSEATGHVFTLTLKHPSTLSDSEQDEYYKELGEMIEKIREEDAKTPQ